MKPIEFDILFWEQPRVELNNLGIRPELDETGIRKVTFYTINNIAPYSEDDKEYCAIRSGGDEYIIADTYLNVKQILDNQF